MCTSNCWPSSQARLRSECSSFTLSCLEVDQMRRVSLEKGTGRLSPEIALGVLLELLPVEPVLVRPHPDFNLLQYFHTSVCLYVRPAPQVSAGGQVCGGNHSLAGSSLQGRSQKKATRIHASSFTEQSNRPPLCSVFCLKKVVTLVHCSVFSTANPFRELSRFGW